MHESLEVCAWLADLDRPLKDVILTVRRGFREADERACCDDGAKA